MSRSRRRSIGLRTRFAVFAASGFRCVYCGRRAGPDVILQVDHRIPVAAGGTNDRENLVAACTACNQGKGAKALEVCGELHRGPLDPMRLPTGDAVLGCRACDRVIVMLGFDGKWTTIGRAA